MRLIFIILIFILSKVSYSQVYTKDTLLMGSSFQITAIHQNYDSAKIAVNKAIKEILRIEKLISSWDKNSQTSLINKNAGIIAVKVDFELFKLIERSIKVSELTNGAFDISYASIDKIWYFDKKMEKLPDSSVVKASVKNINYKNIILNEADTSVFLEEEVMKIGFGGIGKGYAADKAKEKMLEYGIKNGLVNAGGDLICWGKDENNKAWRIGIRNPNDVSKVVSWLELEQTSIVTSGNYEKFIEFNNKKYSHIIDPRTGWPAQGITSVSIICPIAELADALATSVFILGHIEGLKLINSLKGVECIIFTDEFKLLKSDNIELNVLE